MRTAAIALLALPLIGACDADPATPATAIRRDSAGIAIVEQREPAVEPAVFTVAAAPAWVLESDEADPDRVLHEIRNVVFMRDGIAVANAGASQVWIYDEAGELLHVSGGPGEGPGEFSGLSDLHALPGDSLLVRARGRDHVIGPDGTYTRSFQLQVDDGPLLSSTPVGVVGPALVVQSIRAGSEQVREDVSRSTIDVLRFDLTGRFLDTLATVPGWEAYDPPAGSFAIGNMPIPFGRSVWVTASRPGVLTPSSYDNEIRVYDEAGELRRIIRNVAPPPPAVTADEVAAFKERMLANRTGPIRAMFENTLQTIPAASTHPPFGAVHLGTDGTIWVVVRTVSLEGEDLRAIVYDPDGARLGGALLPSALDVKQISLERVMGVWTDSLGLESVRAYDIERRAR